MVARPWSSSRHSCRERILLRCDGNAGNSFPTTQVKDPSPALSGINSRLSRRISRGGALHRKGERNSRVVPPFPESPRCHVNSRENCSPSTALTFKPRIDSNHGGTWDSPVGKPRVKASLESLEGKPHPLFHAKGSATLLLQLGRKAHVHAPTRDED